MHDYRKTFLIILVIGLAIILGCKGVSKESSAKVSQITPNIQPKTSNAVKLCGDWPDKNYTVISKGLDYPLPYQNSKFIGISKNIFSLTFYCASDSLDTVGNYFKRNDYLEISNFPNDGSLGYRLIQDAAGSRNFKVFKNEERKIKPFSTFVLMDVGSGKTVIAAYH